MFDLPGLLRRLPHVGEELVLHVRELALRLREPVEDVRREVPVGLGLSVKILGRLAQALYS